MPISFDLTWLLATAQYPDDASKNFEAFHIRYQGREPLKGVLGGEPVPHFWLDLMYDDQLIHTEHQLAHENVFDCDSSHIKAFCAQFYAANEEHIFKPFIRTDSDYVFSKYPENYGEKLRAWRSRWEKEKKRYDLENPSEPSSDQMAEGENVSPELEQQILDRLTKELIDDSKRVDDKE